MPPPTNTQAATPADRLADRLFAALRAVRRAPSADDRRVYLSGVDRGGGFTVPFVVVVAAFLAAVAPADETCRVFTYGPAVVMEVTAGREQPGIATLAQEGEVTPAAPALLANLVMCRLEREDDPAVEFSLPPKALAALLNAAEVRAGLPRIVHYAKRPVYSPEFVLLGPGYHPDERVLVHGPAVEPDLTPLPAGDTALDRLPPRLRTLLSGFCFASDADLTNFVGLMLTGLMGNLFAEMGKALALIDGNQPGVGKSLLVQTLGVVLDGRTPHLIHYTPNEEELQKRICATLRSGEQTVLTIDNAKEETGSAVSSPTIEANSVAPTISLRVLGTSTNFVRPNDVLWALTMNATRVSPDLVSRGLPIRLQYDGKPEDRAFAGPDPIDYAREHRLEILGELAGLVERWTAAGRPSGTRGHRLTHWARVIGGILAANGLSEFLANYQDAAAEFDAGQDDLVALFELAAAEPNGPVTFTTTPAGNGLPPEVPALAWSADAWTKLLDRAGVGYSTADSETGKKKAIAAWRWLASRLKRTVPITVNGRPAVAELRQVDGRAKAKKYLLLVRPLGADSGLEMPPNTPVADDPGSASSVSPTATPSPPPTTVLPPPTATPSTSPPTVAAPPTPTPDGENGEDW